MPVSVSGHTHLSIEEPPTWQFVHMSMRPSIQPFRRSKFRQYTDHRFLLAINQATQRSLPKQVSPILARSSTALKTVRCLGYNAHLGKEESMSKMMKIELSMYGIAEVLHWCHNRNNGRVPGVDTAGFDKMKGLLAEKPQSGDYFTLDQFWKKRVTLDLTEDEVATIDRCLYDLPNFDSEPLPQIRHKFWPQETAAH
jgi:hypothetical protein